MYIFHSTVPFELRFFSVLKTWHLQSHNTLVPSLLATILRQITFVDGEYRHRFFHLPYAAILLGEFRFVAYTGGGRR